MDVRLLYMIFFLLLISAGVSSRKWKKSKCHRTITTNSTFCFNRVRCTNKHITTDNPNVQTTCESCSTQDYAGMTECDTLARNKTTGRCCVHKNHCCTTACVGCPAGGDCCECVQSIESYYCEIVRQTCGYPIITTFVVNNRTISSTFTVDCKPNDNTCMSGHWYSWTYDHDCWYRLKPNTTEYIIVDTDPCYDNDSCSYGDDDLGLILGVVGGITFAVITSIGALICCCNRPERTSNPSIPTLRAARSQSTLPIIATALEESQSAEETYKEEHVVINPPLPENEPSIGEYVVEEPMKS